MSTPPAKRPAVKALKKKAESKQIKEGIGEQKISPPSRRPKAKHPEPWVNVFNKMDNNPALNALNPYERCLKLSRGTFRQMHDFLKESEQKQDIESMLRAIDHGIENGHLNALRKLVFLAHESTDLLAKWAKTYPDYVRILAKDHTIWPLLCSKSATQNKILFDMLDQIGLDSNRSKGGPHSKVGDSPAGAKKWAADLLRRLDLTRRRRLGVNSMNRPLDLVITKEPNDWDLSYDHPEIATAAEHLPPLTQETWKEWWKLAKELFLTLTDDRPWEIPELASFVRSANYVSDGSKRDAVVKHVQQSFEHLVTACFEKDAEG